MKLPRPILDEFRRHNIKLVYGCGQTTYFHIRIFEKILDPKFIELGEKKWVVQFAYKPTFDRWANSTNFETIISYYPEKNQRYSIGDLQGKHKKQYIIPKLDKELAWCLKCAKSGIFDFNTYIGVIETPRFIY